MHKIKMMSTSPDDWQSTIEESHPNIHVDPMTHEILEGRRFDQIDTELFDEESSVAELIGADAFEIIGGEEIEDDLGVDYGDVEYDRTDYQEIMGATVNTPEQAFHYQEIIGAVTSEVSIEESGVPELIGSVSSPYIPRSASSGGPLAPGVRVRWIENVKIALPGGRFGEPEVWRHGVIERIDGNYVTAYDAQNNDRVFLPRSKFFLDVPLHKTPGHHRGPSERVERKIFGDNETLFDMLDESEYEGDQRWEESEGLDDDSLSALPNLEYEGYQTGQPRRHRHHFARWAEDAPPPPPSETEEEYDEYESIAEEEEYEDVEDEERSGPTAEEAFPDDDEDYEEPPIETGSPADVPAYEPPIPPPSEPIMNAVQALQAAKETLKTPTILAPSASKLAEWYAPQAVPITTPQPKTAIAPKSVITSAYMPQPRIVAVAPPKPKVTATKPFTPTTATFAFRATAKPSGGFGVRVSGDVPHAASTVVNLALTPPKWALNTAGELIKGVGNLFYTVARKL